AEGGLQQRRDAAVGAEQHSEGERGEVHGPQGPPRSALYSDSAAASASASTPVVEPAGAARGSGWCAVRVSVATRGSASSVSSTTRAVANGSPMLSPVFSDSGWSTQ